MTIFSKGSQFLFNAARTVRRAPFPKRLPTSGPRSVHRRSLTARSYHVQVSDIQAEAGFVIGKEAREAAEQTGKTLWGTGLGGTIEDAVDCLEEAARLTKGREKYSDQLTDADKRGMLTYMNMIYDGFDVEAILRQPNNVFVTQRAKAVDNLWVQATQTHAGNKKPVTVVLTPSFGPVLEQNRAHGATVIEFNIHNYDTPEDAVIAMLEFSEQHKDSLSINCIWNPMNPTGFQYGEKIVDMVADGIYRKLFHSLLDESGIYIPGQQQILSPVVKSGALIYGSETKCMLVNSGSKFPLGMALGAGFSVTNWPDFGKVVSMDHSKPNPFIASLYKVGGPMAEARLDRATDYIDAADQLCHELGLLGVATTGSEFPQYQRVAAMSLMYVDRGPLGERGVTIDQVRHVLMHDLEHDIVPVIPHHMLIARGSTNEQRQYARLANTDLYPDQIGQLVEAMSPALTDMRLYDKFHTRQNYNMSPGLGGLAYLKPDSASKQVRKFSTVARPSNDTSTFATVWGLGSVGAALAKLAFDTENKPPKVVSKATHITEVEYTEVDGTESVFPVQVVHPDQVASGEALTGLYTLYAGSGDGFSSILPSLHSQRPSNILAFLNGILPDPPTGVELLDARPQPLRVGVSPDFPIRVPQALVFAGFNASRPSGTGHTLRAGAVFHNGIVLPEVAQPFVDAVADDRVRTDSNDKHFQLSLDKKANNTSNAAGALYVSRALALGKKLSISYPETAMHDDLPFVMLGLQAEAMSLYPDSQALSHYFQKVMTYTRSAVITQADGTTRDHTASTVAAMQHPKTAAFQLDRAMFRDVVFQAGNVGGEAPIHTHLLACLDAFVANCEQTSATNQNRVIVHANEALRKAEELGRETFEGDPLMAEILENIRTTDV